MKTITEKQEEAIKIINEKGWTITQVPGWAWIQATEDHADFCEDGAIEDGMIEVRVMDLRLTHPEHESEFADYGEWHEYPLSIARDLD